ncbi:hypothetical protein RI367_000439 [Sorochytrium milnesiophthora]
MGNPLASVNGNARCRDATAAGSALRRRKALRRASLTHSHSHCPCCHDSDCSSNNDSDNDNDSDSAWNDYELEIERAHMAWIRSEDFLGREDQQGDDNDNDNDGEEHTATDDEQGGVPRNDTRRADQGDSESDSDDDDDGDDGAGPAGDRMVWQTTMVDNRTPASASNDYSDDIPEIRALVDEAIAASMAHRNNTQRRLSDVYRRPAATASSSSSPSLLAAGDQLRALRGASRTAPPADFRPMMTGASRGSVGSNWRQMLAAAREARPALSTTQEAASRRQRATARRRAVVLEDSDAEPEWTSRSSAAWRMRAPAPAVPDTTPTDPTEPTASDWVRVVIDETRPLPLTEPRPGRRLDAAGGLGSLDESSYLAILERIDGLAVRLLDIMSDTLRMSDQWMFSVLVSDLWELCRTVIDLYHNHPAVAEFYVMPSGLRRLLDREEASLSEQMTSLQRLITQFRGLVHMHPPVSATGSAGATASSTANSTARQTDTSSAPSSRAQLLASLTARQRSRPSRPVAPAAEPSSSMTYAQVVARSGAAVEVADDDAYILPDAPGPCER